MSILVFATSIVNEKDALNISNLLKNYFNLKSASFDLDDRERILRIEGKNVRPNKIADILSIFGHRCIELS